MVLSGRGHGAHRCRAHPRADAERGKGRRQEAHHHCGRQGEP